MVEKVYVVIKLNGTNQITQIEVFDDAQKAIKSQTETSVLGEASNYIIREIKINGE